MKDSTNKGLLLKQPAPVKSDDEFSLVLSIVVMVASMTAYTIIF